MIVGRRGGKSLAAPAALYLACFRDYSESPDGSSFSSFWSLRETRGCHLGHGEHEHDHPRHEGTIEIGDTFKNPKFRSGNRLQMFDRVVSNPMWNQDWFKEDDYDADELGRFPQSAGFPGAQSADWGWAQHILASLNGNGRAAIVLDTGAASRGSGNVNKNKEIATATTSGLSVIRAQSDGTRHSPEPRRRAASAV